LLKTVQGVLQWFFLRMEAVGNRVFGDRLNPMYYLGATSYWMFWIVVASGLYVYAFYETGIDKTYATLARYYWWPNMSTDVKNFVRTCDYCQRSKGRTLISSGSLSPVAIPQERWEVVTMDFVTGLPKTKQGFDMIMTVVDKLSKRAHFIPGRTTADAQDVADIFTAEIFRLHGLPATIISDRDSKFTSKFWQHLMQRLGTRIGMSTANHPQTDGQTE